MDWIGTTFKEDLEWVCEYCSLKFMVKHQLLQQERRFPCPSNQPLQGEHDH